MLKYSKRLAAVFALSITMASASPASAAVIESVNVGGFTTFQDTNTGLVWLDLDNFFGLSHDAMAAAAVAAGFTVATRTDVETLLNTLPLPDATVWGAYAAIMGSAPNRDLIWGSYGPVQGALVGWAFANDFQTSWSFLDGATPSANVPNAGSAIADMNIWAYQTGNVAVPEPATLMLLGLGVAGLAARRRRARA